MGHTGPLTDLLERISHREFRTRQLVISNAWNEPSRGDYYLMQISQRIQQVLNRKPERIKLNQQKINFESPQSATKPKETLKQTKNRWRRFVGLK